MGVDPVGGRCGAGPRGSAAWEERGGRHPRVGGGVHPPSTGYVVVRLSHVSPFTTRSLPPRSLSHRPLSTPTAHFPRCSPSGLPWTSHLWGLPPLGPAPPSDLAAPPRTQAARRGACSGSHSTLLLRLQQLQQPRNKRLRVVSEVPKLTHAVVLSTDPKSFLNTHHHHTQWLLVTFTRSDLFIRIKENLS